MLVQEISNTSSRVIPDGYRKSWRRRSCFTAWADVWGNRVPLWMVAQQGGDGTGPLPVPLSLCWVSLDALAPGGWGFLLTHSQSKAGRNPKASPTFPRQQSPCPEQTQRKTYLVLEICIAFHANLISNYILFHPSPVRMVIGIFVQAHSIILIHFLFFSDF